MGKSWEEMSHKERAEQTIRDIKKRDIKRKRRAERLINSFIIESSIKSVTRKRKAKTRGCRSCK